MKPRSILVLSPSRFEQPERVGGAERYVDEVAAALSRRDDVRHVQVIAFSHNPSRERVSDKLAIQTYSTKWLKGNSSNPLFNPLCLKHADWDLLYLHQFHTWLTPAAVAWAKAKRAPLVMTDHNGGGPTFNRALRLDRFIDVFLAVSNISVQDCKLSPKRTAIIYGGVDTEKFRPRRQSVPGRDGILFVGRATPIKGLEQLLGAASQASGSGQITLALAATGPSSAYAERLKALWNNIGAESQIKVDFILNPSSETLLELYQRNKWTVLPSIDSAQGRECLGLTLLESMACDTPTAASPFCGVAELAKQFPTDSFRVVNDWKQFIEQAFVQPAPSGARNWALEHATWDAVAGRILKAVAKL